MHQQRRFSFFFFFLLLLAIISGMSIVLFLSFSLSSPATPRLIRRIPASNFVLVSSPPPLTSVVLPDHELLLLLPPHYRLPSSAPPTCLFPSGESSPAFTAGTLSSSRRPLLRCAAPSSGTPSPQLVFHRHPIHQTPHNQSHTVHQWNFLVYDSISTAADLIVFAKGINKRRNSDRRPSDLRCVFFSGDTILARTPVTSSVQEVFRCHHPNRDLAASDVSLELAGQILPSIAPYAPPPPPPPAAAAGEKAMICACTMVRDVAKFLPEWVTYHSRIGVDRFVLYDNGSSDELDRTVARLVEKGHRITTHLWPWPKTQEAGFSHAAVVNRESCEWMMFLDVDEFLYSPQWTGSSEPDRRMLPRLLPVRNDSGQVSVNCRDFGPSGQKEHPMQGVIQGYTCRLKEEERHKSLVRLESVHDSLQNVVHHFTLKDGFTSVKPRTHLAVVNHYKYQAWPEFRKKFRMRVSAYVVDWTHSSNAASKDRAPGLGFKPVEPPDWTGRYCQVNDTRLKKLALKWFGPNLPWDVQ